jgi:phosphoribosyl 1,2-cyclic phosphodiesterase
LSRFCPLYSSSKGNGIFLSGGGTCLLVDAGVSYRSLAASLDEQGYSPLGLSAVLVTHEHTDHIRGLRTLLARAKIPLYASKDTLEYLWLNDYIPAGTRVFECEGEFAVGDIAVKPFCTPHDAARSLGYRFTMPDMRTVAIATDLGHVTEEVRLNLLGCDLVMLESNYDINMLDCSAYPYPLKRRIKSDYGHLSNEACAAFLPQLVQNGATRLVLGHLSENNNVPELARETAQAELARAGMREERDYTLHVAPARGKTRAVVF